jgi:hypothetical protein
MKSLNQMIPLIDFILAIYIAVTEPFGVTLTLIGVAAIIFSITGSFTYVAGVFIAGLAIKYAQRAGRVVESAQMSTKLVGSPLEGFAGGAAAKDPASIQHRLEGARMTAPKVANVTGVLESPGILDNTPLQPMEELSAQALPGASIPASAKGRVLIHPPAEGFVPAPNGSQDKGPKENPYLQNGPDNVGVDTSLLEKGTDAPIENPAADVAGTMIGSAPAF